MSYNGCDNCGDYFGTRWGKCQSCTPRGYIRAYEEREALYKEAEVAWRNYSYDLKKKFFRDYKKDKQKALNAILNSFVEERLADYKKKKLVPGWIERFDLFYV